MKITFKTAPVFAILLIPFATGCSIKSAVPEFDYPTYTDEVEWPKLAPTSEVSGLDTTATEAAIEEIEALEQSL